MKEKLLKAEKDRSVQMRYWSNRVARFQQAAAEGRSTYWLAKEFGLQPRAVRRFRREMSGL